MATAILSISWVAGYPYWDANSEVLLVSAIKVKKGLLRESWQAFHIEIIPATSYSPTQLPAQYHRLQQA